MYFRIKVNPLYFSFKIGFYLWFKVDILPLIQSWHFTSDSKLTFSTDSKLTFYLWFKVDILPLIQNWLLPLIQSWHFTSDSKLTFYLWSKVDILPLIQSWYFKVILHQFWVKKIFPWKFNLEYSGTFTKLFTFKSKYVPNN